MSDIREQQAMELADALGTSRAYINKNGLLMIQQALHTAHASGFAEARELAAQYHDRKQAEDTKRGYGLTSPHMPAAQYIRALKSDGEGAGS